MLLKRFGFVGLLLLLSVSSVLAQEATDTEVDADDESKRRMRHVLESSIEWFEFHQSGQEKPLEAKNVLRWTNNARESIDGMTVVWINDTGRPEVIGAAFPYGELFCLEFDSLSRSSFQATLKGEAYWEPGTPGLTFATFEKAPKPPKSAGARLLQMKALARKFDVAMLGWKPNANQREELRLLPRPLHRYKLESSAEILDGGLFAFTSGTDPEAVVVIEAVKRDDQFEWQYAFARRTSGALAAKLGEQTVWEVKAYPNGASKVNTHRGHREPLAPLLNAVE